MADMSYSFLKNKGVNKEKLITKNLTNSVDGDYVYENISQELRKKNDVSDASDVKNFNYYQAIKKNRHKSELIPVTLARRLLRTKRILVLPAHVNITVITNSYDVVHSWFIPGLGIKMDCVPGRSTHHTFYVDNVGFYYGQCAEICGRYHHHMPIRICALPFESFLVWWQKKGLPRLNRLNDQGSDKLRDKYYNIIAGGSSGESYTNKKKHTTYKYNW